jgi:hypothetical protein
MTTAEALDVARQLIARLRNRGGGKIGFDELDLDAADALAALVIQVEHDAKTLAVLRADLADPPADVQEHVIRKLDLVHRSAVTRAFAAAAQLLELSPSELRLMAGEMTAQEMRTVLAVLRNRAAVIQRGGDA